jgi:hypothetical protein
LSVFAALSTLSDPQPRGCVSEADLWSAWSVSGVGSRKTDSVVGAVGTRVAMAKWA